jgi:hypothetical protein
MSTGEQVATHATTGAGQQGWLAGPVSRGLALVLLTANLAVMGLIAQAQAETHERLETIASFQPSTALPDGADPELCWLAGAQAYAAGQGEKLKAVLVAAGGDTSCLTDALRGAAGVNR